MKVLQLVHCYPPEPVGGTERIAASMVKGLADRGHELHVLSGSLNWEKGFRVENDEYQGVPVTRVHRDDPWFDRWDNSYHPLVEQIYRELLRDLKPDVIHLHHWIRLTRNLVQVALEEGVPTVVQLHDFHVSCPRTFRLKEDRSFCNEASSVDACLECVKRWPFQGDAEVGTHLDHYLRDMLNEFRGARRVLALSRAQARLINTTLPGREETIEILPPGAPKVLSPGGPHAAVQTLRVVHWGNLYDLKGILHLVDAVALAREKAPVELQLFGRAAEPSFGKELEERIQGLPVALKGAFDWRELESIQADVAVFPSLCPETYSLVVDEAFMLGLPVVVSDMGALPERIGEGGLVIPPGDSRSLADLLVRLARDRGELARLAKGVKKCWMTQKEVAARAEEIYAEVLEGKGESLAPLRPLSTMDRLKAYWLTAGMRLASLVGSNVLEPPAWRRLDRS